MDLKVIIGIITVLMSIGVHLVYIRDIFKGVTKPHIYSWLVWSLLTYIVFYSQLTNDGGPGAWSTGVAGTISLFIGLLAFKRGTKNITKTDTVVTLVALSILPLWAVTGNALIAVLIATTVDALAFFPTVRKTYHHPSEETLSLYLINTVRHSLTLAALSSLIFINYFYPAMLVVMNGLVAVVIIVRKKKLDSAAAA